MGFGPRRGRLVQAMARPKAKLLGTSARAGEGCLLGGAVGQGGVMQHDADGAVRLAEEGPGFVHGGDRTLVVGEVDIAHGVGKHAMELDHLIAHHAVFPGLDGKTCVVGIGRIATHEVGQGASFRGPEGLGVDGEGGFEGHRTVWIGVGLIQHLLGRGLRLGEAPAGVGLADRQQTSAPALLRLQYLRFADVGVHAQWRAGLEGVSGQRGAQHQGGDKEAGGEEWGCAEISHGAGRKGWC